MVSGYFGIDFFDYLYDSLLYGSLECLHHHYYGGFRIESQE